MHISVFLLISFITLCKPFILAYKKYSPNFISQHKLNMGCDYYIDKDLELYDNNNNIFSHINLKHERGYYWFVSVLDEDEDGYHDEYALYIKQRLEPSMKPIVIYSNNSFNKLSFEHKYKEIIDNELKCLNKTWNHVNNIIKIENRYER